MLLSISFVQIKHIAALDSIYYDKNFAFSPFNFISKQMSNHGIASQPNMYSFVHYMIRISKENGLLIRMH